MSISLPSRGTKSIGPVLNNSSHWVFAWFLDNVHVFAAVMTLFGHTRRRLFEVTASMSLLRPHPSTDSTFITVTQDLGVKLEGCYLHWDTESYTMIRSGKVAGRTRNMYVRNVEHRAGSTLATTASRMSNFYNRYPSLANLNHDALVKARGSFDSLVQLVGIAFNRNSSDAMEVLLTDKLFTFTDTQLDKLNAYALSGADTLLDRKLIMLSYGFELTYDLSLETAANVSSSPGFESLTGEFCRE